MLSAIAYATGYFDRDSGYRLDNLVGDLEKLAAAYDLPFLRLTDMQKAEETIDAFLQDDRSVLMECVIDPMDLVK